MKSGFFYKILLYSFLFFSLNLASHAQSTQEYLAAAGDYASIYSGKLENNYVRFKYDNFPYYSGTSLLLKKLNFTYGDLVYQNKLYPNQKLRLDMYKEQLIIQTPKQHEVVLNTPDIQQFTLYGKTFVWRNPNESSGLRPGFYIQLYKSDLTNLYAKVILSRNEKIDNKTATYIFRSMTQYYLLVNDVYYQVKNARSFILLLPQYKKQIKQYVRDSSLDFREYRDDDLVLLTQFCEPLLSSK